MSNPIIIIILLSIHRLIFMFLYNVYLYLLVLFYKLCSQCVFLSIFTLIYILHKICTVSVNHKKVLLIFNVLTICSCLYVFVCMFISLKRWIYMYQWTVLSAIHVSNTVLITSNVSPKKLTV